MLLEDSVLPWTWCWHSQFVHPLQPAGLPEWNAHNHWKWFQGYGRPQRSTYHVHHGSTPTHDKGCCQYCKLSKKKISWLSSCSLSLPNFGERLPRCLAQVLINFDEFRALWLDKAREQVSFFQLNLQRLPQLDLHRQHPLQLELLDLHLHLPSHIVDIQKVQ